MTNNTNSNPSLVPMLKTLEALFDAFNDRLFDGKLPHVVITVNTDTTKGAYGWFTCGKTWSDDKGEYYEITITAEYLNRDFYETAGTLLHEMVHEYNREKGITDCSKNGYYHNKKFYEACVTHGLTCEKVDKYGYSLTSLTESSKLIAQPFALKFDLYRKNLKVKKVRRTNKMHKYVCPECGAIVRTTKLLNITCTDCQCEFVIAN